MYLLGTTCSSSHCTITLRPYRSPMCRFRATTISLPPLTGRIPATENLQGSILRHSSVQYPLQTSWPPLSEQTRRSALLVRPRSYTDRLYRPRGRGGSLLATAS